MSKVKEKALEEYPDYVGFDDVSKTLEHVRNAYVEGYNQAQQDLMEKAKQWFTEYIADKSVQLLWCEFEQFIMEN